QTSYPNFSYIALDILSILAMLVVPEYLFSSTKFLISELQNKLGVDIIKAFECLKLW
ncbi:uncharacterized protein K444DRAFT_489053, partial [Hyaloscypha bicolor E]